MDRNQATTLVWKLEGTYGVVGLRGASRSAWIQRREEIEKQIIDALCEDKWIPVSDILPEPYMQFLAWFPDKENNIKIGYFDHEFERDWFITEGYRYGLSEITHYQPLSKGPREEDECDDSH